MLFNQLKKDTMKCGNIYQECIRVQKAIVVITVVVASLNHISPQTLLCLKALAIYVPLSKTDGQLQ